MDPLEQYKRISAKLRKRFLKKPNVAEASEEFAGLARQLNNQESYSYSGFCHLAEARCQHTLGSCSGEVQALTEAGRAFLTAEQSIHDLSAISLDTDVNAAINCYNHAIRVGLENKHCALAAKLCIELGNTLKKLGKSGEAMQHYQRAADLQAQIPLDCLMALERVASCKIDTNDFEGALTVATEMTYLAQERGTVSPSGRPIGVISDYLARCEILRILLLMILKPTPQRIRPEHAQLLEKYSWDVKEDEASFNCLDEDLYMSLQSLVMACQTRDIDAVQRLQADLWPHFTAEQNHLLHLVLQEVSYPSEEP